MSADEEELQQQKTPPNEESPLLDSEKESNTENPEKDEPKLNLPLMYIFFRLHRFICVISLALIMIAQALPPPHHRPILVSFLVHIYAFIASAIGIVIELELSQWFVDKIVPILEHWHARGLFYVFLALFAMEQSTFSHPTDEDSEGDDFNDHAHEFLHLFGSAVTSVILWVASIGLLVTGSLYFFMSILFMRRLKEKSDEEYERRLKEMDGEENDDSVE